MIVQGKLEKPSKYAGKQYWYDFDTDGLYIELRRGSSEYSDMSDNDDLLYVIDYDRDGNIVGVTLESALSRAAKRELSLRLKIALMLFRMRLIPAQVIASLIASSLKRLVEKIPNFEPNSSFRPATI